MHFDARVCGFCRPLTLLCWHDVSDIFSYYRLFVDDLIDTLGLKLYILSIKKKKKSIKIVE